MVAPEPLPGMHVEDGDEPGMHRTDSTDFGVVLSGNVAIELDDGVEVLLSPVGSAPTSRAVARFAVSHAACTCPVSVNMSGNSRAVSKTEGAILRSAACVSALRNKSARIAWPRRKAGTEKAEMSFGMDAPG